MKCSVKTLLIFSFFLLLSSVNSQVSKCFKSNKTRNNVDAGLPITNLVHQYGYPIETHKVQTEDGYILTMHRIPSGRNNGHKILASQKPVVFLMHGVLSSSADWCSLGPEQAFALILADAGFDVWAGNQRGNTYSREHASMDPDKDDRFWKFSFHEIGLFDVPSMIDYALETSGVKQLFYVGHSQGTSAYFAMASMKPEYNVKVKAAFAFAPIGYMKHLPNNLLRRLSLLEKPAAVIFDLVGKNEWFPNDDFNSPTQKDCLKEALYSAMCGNDYFLMNGYNSRSIDPNNLDIICTYIPAGASTRQLLHYGQLIHSKYFRAYDRRLLGNILKYKQIFPPSYPIEKITSPVTFFYSANDTMASPRDVKKLYKRISNKNGLFLVQDSSFTHIDYLWGTNVPALVYKQTIEIMKTFLIGSSP